MPCSTHTYAGHRQEEGGGTRRGEGKAREDEQPPHQGVEAILGGLRPS